MSAQIIEMGGRPAFAVVPFAEWTALLERLEELQDIADFKEAIVRDEETLPLALVERRLAGEHPLRLWREHRGLTLQALAERVGCTRQMLSMIERGKAAPPADLLARLAAALGVEIDDLGKVCSTPAADAVAGLGFHIVGSGMISAAFRGRFSPRRGLWRPRAGLVRPVGAHLPHAGLHKVPARHPEIGQHQERGDLRCVLP